MLVKKKSSTSKDKCAVGFYTESCRYDVIFNNVQKLNWKRIDDQKLESHANIIWIDISVIQEKMRNILPWQIINHCPGMPNIARKNRMGQNLNKMQIEFPQEYNYYPKTWVLPNDMAEFRNQFDESDGSAIGGRVYIIKPDGGAQGRGIFLTNTLKSVPHYENVVAQTYLRKPMLIDGFKFDLRIYVYVASVKPLRVYLFNDGLVRICTEPYVEPTNENMSHPCMHLTNYAVNKSSATFQQPTTDGSERETGDGVNANKKSLSWFLEWVAELHGKEKSDNLFRRIGTIAMRTILSIAPTLSREYDLHFNAFRGVPVRTQEPNNEGEGCDDGDNCQDEDCEKETGADVDSPNPIYEGISIRGSRCFEVLGLDVMVDESFRPWLVEVNHLPSFGTDSPLDLDVKDRLMTQIFSTIPALPDDEQAFKRHQREQAKRRLHIQKGAAIDTNAKIHERNAATNYKSSLRAKQQTDPMEWDNSLQKVTEESLFDAEYEKEEQTIEKKMLTLPPVVILDEEPQVNTVDETKQQLQAIYEIHCPEKVNRIDALLQRYTGVEQQFLEYVREKYRSVTNQEASNIPVNAEVSNINRIEEKVSLLLNEGKESGPLRRRRVKQLRIPQHPPFRTPSTGPLGNITTRPADIPLSRKRNDENSIRDPQEEAFRQEVLAQMWSTDASDPWLSRESSILTSFVRLFPPIETANSESIHTCSNNNGDDEDDVDDNSDGEYVNKESPKRKRSPSASLQEIMMKVFDMDRRQMMRMTRPLRALTPERRAPETADISISPEEAAEAVRQQAEVVNRLYLGLSSNSTNPQSTCLTDSNSPQTISKVPIRPRSKLLTQSGMKMMMQVPLVPRTITFDFEQQRKIM